MFEKDRDAMIALIAGFVFVAIGIATVLWVM